MTHYTNIDKVIFVLPGAGTLSTSLFLGFGGRFAGVAPSALDSIGAFSRPK